MSLCGDAIRQAGANKAASGPTGLGIRRPLLRKETGERKSYAIDRPFFLILFGAGQIETEMHKRNRGRVPNLFLV